MKQPKTPARKKSLADFVLAKKRAICPICQLPKGARDQLREAQAKKIPIIDQLEWLQSEYHTKITRDALTIHRNARHEQ